MNKRQPANHFHLILIKWIQAFPLRPEPRELLERKRGRVGRKERRKEEREGEREKIYQIYPFFYTHL